MEPYILFPSFATSIRFIPSKLSRVPNKLGLVVVSHGKLEPRPQYLTKRLGRMRRSLCASW
jgi:hypothetical protein